jgi:hypothetical protein
MTIGGAIVFREAPAFLRPNMYCWGSVGGCFRFLQDSGLVNNPCCRLLQCSWCHKNVGVLSGKGKKYWIR